MPAPEGGAADALPAQFQQDAGNNSDAVAEAELLSALPPALVEAFRPGGDPKPFATFIAQFSASTYRGPLPPASELRAYEEILPGSASRIITMAEDQARHRHEIEKTAVDGGGRRAWWGLWLGFAISVIVIGACVVLVLAGHDVAGTALGSVDLVALAAVFVIGRVDQRKERVQKNAGTHTPTT